MQRVARWVAGLLLLGGLAWRVLAAEPSPATFDEVSFTRALSQFDLLAFEPHFPGYPLSVLLARIPHALGSTAPYAWVAGILGLAVGPWAFRASGGGCGGVVACAALALAPLAVDLGSRPLADATGSALVVGGVALAWGSGRGLAAALLLGAAAAAKPDYAVWGSALLPALARAGARRRATILLAWSGPLVIAAWAAARGCGGWGPFVDEAQRFLHGHLFAWGGSVAADPRPRLVRFAQPLGAGFGARGTAAALLGLIGALGVMLRAPQRTRRAAVFAALPYGLYTLFAQNLDHPRHVLPLLLVGALLAGRGLNRLPVRQSLIAGLVGVAVCGATSEAWRAAQQQAARGRPADRLLAALDGYDSLSLRVYTGYARPLAERRPLLDVRSARNLAHVTQLLAADPAPPQLILVGGEIPGASRLPCLVLGDGFELHRWERAASGL